MTPSGTTGPRALPFDSALVVAPHADDEALGAGGLIARLTRAGSAVHSPVSISGAARSRLF